MKIDIQFVNMSVSEAMEAYTVGKLDKLAQKYEWLIAAEVFFKKEKDPKGKGKICEIQLSHPGPRIFASSNEKNYELSVKETLKDLEKQLKKLKGQLKPYM